MNCEIILKWNTGQPTLIGLYFVAVTYGAGAGEFQFASWNGKKWELQPEGTVEAFMDIQSFKNQLNIQWPQPEKNVSGSNISGQAPWEES